MSSGLWRETPVSSVTLSYTAPSPATGRRHQLRRGAHWWSALAVTVALCSDGLDGFSVVDMFGAPGRWAIKALGPSRLDLPDWGWVLIAGLSLAAGWALRQVSRSRPKSVLRKLHVLRFSVFGFGMLGRIWG